MGTIVQRPRRDGTVAYMAQILIMRDRKIVFRENKTFDRRQAAAAWLARREADLEKPDAVLSVAPQARKATLADAIDKYIASSIRKIGRTKAQVLAAVKSYDIAGKACADITSQDIVALAESLGKSRQPQTVSNYLSHLAAVFAIARPAWGYQLDPQAMADAFKVTRRLGMTQKSASRDRRPTLDEINIIMNHFAEKTSRRPNSTPMTAIVAFAIFSTRRLDEITRITWADLDVDGSRVKVRDMKNPGEKIGNDVWCDLPAPALRIIKTMPRTHERIFPWAGESISAAFTRAMQFLAIPDLHFHDLRHEGVSRLFEMGMNIPHVAAVSGHRSWASLKRYSHLRQSGDKFSDWPWLETVEAEMARRVVSPPVPGGIR